MVTKENISACPTRIALDRLVEGLRPEEVEAELRLAIAAEYFAYAESRHENADLIFGKALGWLGDQPYPYDDVDLAFAYCGEGTRRMVASRNDIKSLRLPGGAKLVDWLPAILSNLEIESLYLDFRDVEDCDLESFTKLVHLRSLSLRNTSVSDAGLAHLSALPALEFLDLKKAKVTAVGLGNWLPRTLRWLSLSHVSLDTQLGMKLAQCSFLETLLIKKSRVLVESLQLLKESSNLTCLHLDDCCLEDAHLEVISQMTTLEDLSVDGNVFTDSGFTLIARLPKLRELRMDRVKLTSKAFDALRDNSTLELLSVYKAGSFAGLDKPRWVSSVKELSVHGCELDQEFLTGLKEANKLEKLSIEIGKLDPEPLIEAISALPLKDLTLFLDDDSIHSPRCPSPHPQLEEVWLGISHSERVDLQSWLEISNLRSFEVGPCKIGSGPPLDFSRCPLLESLKLYDSAITDDDLAGLQNHENLQSLQISENKVTDDGLRMLGTLKSLQTLYIEDTQVTGDSIDWSAQFPALTTLWMSRSMVSDRGLKAIAQLPNLESLWMEGMAFSESGLQALTGNESIKELNGVRLESDPLNHPVLHILASMPSLGYLRLELLFEFEEELRTEILEKLRALGSSVSEVVLTQKS